MSINTRSNYLTILIATYNRLEPLKVVIEAINAQTKCSHEIIVIDGGSTDGTIEYLKSRNMRPAARSRHPSRSNCMTGR